MNHAKKKKSGASALEALREHTKASENDDQESDQKKEVNADLSPIPGRNHPADWTDPTKWPLHKPPRKGS
jgi:hypothetical protein